MTNTQKLRLRLPSIAGSTIAAENLRNDPTGALVPVGELPAINILDGSVPVGSYRHSSGTLYTFRLNGTSLEIVSDDSSTLVALPGEYRCMTPLNNAVVIMTTEGPLRLNLSSSGWHVASSDMPPIAVEVDSQASFSGVTPATNLRGEYTRWSGPLDTADADTVTRNILALYDRLSLTAAESGYFTQPVAVTYTVTDAEGCNVALSSPTVISPQGFQGVAPLSAKASQSGGKYTSIGGFPLDLKAFNLRLRIPGIVNQPLTFIDGKASVRLTLPTGIFTILITTTPLSPIARKRSARFSFDTADATITAQLPKESPLPSPEGFHQYNPVGLPHSFTAATAATVGDMVAWGDITPLSALPPAPSELAANCAVSVAWTGMTRVTILHPDGSEEILSRTESGTSHAPRYINPYVGYTHPHAVRLEIAVTESDGTSRYLSLPLSPHPNSSFSYYYDTSGLPVEIPCSTTVISPITRRSGGNRLSGTVAVAPMSDPLNIASSLSVTTGKVSAITPAARSSSAWDFARRHMYVFSTAGIHAVAVNPAKSIMSAHIIDTATVQSEQQVAMTPNGVMAVADGKLLAVTGAKAQIVTPRFNASAIAWNPAKLELWALMDGKVTVMALSKESYLRTDIGVIDSIHSSPGMLLLRRGSRFYDALNENTAVGSRKVKWSVRIMAPDYLPSRINRLKWVLNASDAAINLSVEGDNGSGHPHLIARNFVKGAVFAPVTLTFPSAPVRYITVTVEGTVSHDAKLNTIFFE